MLFFFFFMDRWAHPGVSNSWTEGASIWVQVLAWWMSQRQWHSVRVCTSVCACMCSCLCVCVRERERQRERSRMSVCDFPPLSNCGAWEALPSQSNYYKWFMWPVKRACQGSYFISRKRNSAGMLSGSLGLNWQLPFVFPVKELLLWTVAFGFYTDSRSPVEAKTS